MKRALLIVVLFPLSWAAQAACSSCSTAAASCAAGSSQSEVQSCVNSMPDNGVLTFASGTYAMAIKLDNRNGITVRCATSPLTRGAATTNPCTMSSQNAFSWDSASGHATNLIRITGFRFTHATGPSVTFGRSYSNGWIDKFRVDHNTFTGQANSIATGHGDNPAGYQIFGVIDSNLFEGSTATYPMQFLGDSASDWSPALAGTGAAIFIEDNTFNFASEVSGSCLDIWRGGRLVARFNTVTNCRFSTHGICHRGPALYEVYANTMSGGPSLDGYRIIHHQGSGEFISFNNAVSGSSASMEVQHYRSDDNAEASTCTGAGIQAKCDGTWGSDGNRSGGQGYPCYRQPGRDSAATLRPLYMWNNTVNGSRALTDINDSGTGPSRLASHMQANRDYYDTTNAMQTSATSPFNGSSGMGWGTLANRPTTCTPTPAAADAGNGGVGYWATDQGNWNGYVGATQGRLYNCSATNTWTTYYEPYKYPHPLRVLGGPAPPGNLRQGWLREVLGEYGVAETR